MEQVPGPYLACEARVPTAVRKLGIGIALTALGGRPVAALLLLLSVGAAWALPGRDGAWLLLLHTILPLLVGLVALPAVVAALRAAPRDGLLWGAVGAAVLCVAGGAVAWTPLPQFTRELVLWLHTAAGTLCLLLVLVRLAQRSSPRRIRVGSFGLAALLLAPLGVYSVGEAVKQRPAIFAAPRYDAEACFRFLTAMAAEDSGTPLFPSALRIDPSAGAASADCTHSGCHAGYGNAHATAGANAAYRKTLVDFAARRGGEAARWCRGCHAPETLRETVSTTGNSSESFTCLTCHGAREIHAGYGNAALALGAAPELSPAVGWLPATPWLRRKHHSERLLRAGVPASSEFCGGCHRKNWSLPQNEYRWLPGPDEYRDWRESAYSGLTPYAPGPATPAKGCTGCHAPHVAAGSVSSEKAERPPRRFLMLDAFLRRDAPATVAPVDRSLAPRPGETALLGVVVRNTGIGHDFPTGMPDLQEAWLEVRVSDVKGRVVLASGIVPSAQVRDDRAHYYRLAALDRDGRVVTHGDLDRMVAVAEWRRIPAGEADLARYRLTVPAGGLGKVSVRLLRRRRPEFAQWAGE